MWLQRIFRRDNPKSSAIERSAAHEQPLGLDASAIRQLNRLRLVGPREIKGFAVGGRRGNRRKPAMDFIEHRMYVPGDDFRFVDWRASARQEGIFIRQGTQPKEATVHIVLDASGSMAWGNPPKQHGQKKLALALSYLALANGDRLMLHAFNDQGIQHLGPLTGKRQLTAVLRFLGALRYVGDQKLDVVFKYMKSKVSWGGMVYILSDMIGEKDVTQTLGILPPPFWYLTILHMLHADELSPKVQGSVEMVDHENGEKANYDVSNQAITDYAQRLKEWEQDLDLICVENKAFYSLVPTTWSLASEMLPLLRAKKVVEAV